MFFFVGWHHRWAGRASGEGRALIAAQKAIASPLLDDISIEGATGILINFTGGLDLKITDYGLSRNKDTNTTKDTMMMTGCGSALWMGECLPLTR